MGGNNHHYIPQFLQKGFAVAGSGGTKIWRITKAKWLPTRPGAIDHTASYNSFYSRAVDDKITDEENAISIIVRGIRGIPVGTEVDAEVATRIVAHFSPRTAHVREVFERGIRQVIFGVEQLFSDSEQVKSMVGIDHREPNDAFRTHVFSSLRDDKMFASMSLPDSVVERIAFYIAKEQFEIYFEKSLPKIKDVISQICDRTSDAIRIGHNRGLGDQDGKSARCEVLKSLSWTIVAGPHEGAILPDCVALAISQTGATMPFMFAELDDCAAVMMPLGEEVLLLGVKDGWRLPLNFDFNQEAARSSHSFFLAPKNDDRVAKLQCLIGENSSCIIDEQVNSCMRNVSLSNSVENSEEDSADISSLCGFRCSIMPQKKYDVSFVDCADESCASIIASKISDLVNNIREFLPLSRLDGITFAADYPSVLKEIDRGKPRVGQPTTIEQNVGIGVGQDVLVVRGGVTMSRIVVDCSIIGALTSEDEQQFVFPIGLMASLLVNVAITELIDEALPGILLSPIPEYCTNFLYTWVDGAAEKYVSSYICAALGDFYDNTGDIRKLLSTALIRMQETVAPARHAFSIDGDLDKLMKVTMPAIQHVLMFAAELLGHTAGLAVEAVPPGSELEAALARTGLNLWLPLYWADLEGFRKRLGRWESFDEFAVFSDHVERLMWQVGMFSWRTADGIRIEIPIVSDGEWLMADFMAPHLKSK